MFIKRHPAKKRAPKKRQKRPTHPLPDSTWDGRTLTLIFHLPMRVVSPNGRTGHWAAGYREKRLMKSRAKLLALATLGTARPTLTTYSIRGFWKGDIGDSDNLLGSCKAYLDGIATALGANDKNWSVERIERKGGDRCPRVEVVMNAKLCDGREEKQ